MKIALVTRRYPPLIGGAERVLSYLAPALSQQGSEVTVVTSEIPGTDTTKTDQESAVPIVRLPTSSRRFLGTIVYMRSLRRWLTDHRPDVIYVSMLKHDAYVAVEVGQRLGIPVVLRPEGAGDTGDLAWQKWGRFGRRIGKKCKQADAFVAISPAIRAELVAEGYDEARIHDVPNGVPLPVTEWTPANSQRAVFVGRLAPEKNLESLLDAWRIVLNNHRGSSLLLIGDGPERSKLEAKAKSLKFDGGTIQFLGTIADPSHWLGTSDLFVLPSKEEGMSIALLEAMARGIPIVASDIPGNRRLISHQVHGRLASPDQPMALAAAILAQWAEPEAAAQMAAEARKRVIENYSIEAVARKHLELFDHLITGRELPC